MASYIQLAWSFITFLYKDEPEEAPPPPTKWILYATQNSTQSPDTECLGSRIFWNLTFTLLAIVTAYAIVCLCKNNTYRRYWRHFRSPTFITNTITSLRNRLSHLLNDIDY